MRSFLVSRVPAFHKRSTPSFGMRPAVGGGATIHTTPAVRFRGLRAGHAMQPVVDPPTPRSALPA